jgi:hypothetical protein
MVRHVPIQIFEIDFNWVDFKIFIETVPQIGGRPLRVQVYPPTIA